MLTDKGAPLAQIEYFMPFWSLKIKVTIQHEQASLQRINESETQYYDG